MAKNYTYTQQMHNNTWDHNTSRWEGRKKKKIQELFEFVQLRGKEKDSVVTWQSACPLLTVAYGDRIHVSKQAISAHASHTRTNTSCPHTRHVK